jgi:broad specificity phosphatase PhoE
MGSISEIGPELDIYLVRHGQSTANADKVMQGRADYPLSEEGILQARVVGRYILSTGVKLNNIFTSPLARARRTAEEISRRFVPPPEVISINGFEEIDLGSLTDMPVEQARMDHPEFFQAARDELEGYDGFGGESKEKFEERVEEGLRNVLEKHADGDSILITAHGGTSIVLIRLLFGVEGMDRMLKLHNCFLAKIERRFITGEYRCRLDYYITPVQQQLMLEGLGYMRGLTEEE